MLSDPLCRSRLLAGFFALFLVLGLADFALTWLLLELGDGSILESNPVANYWLARIIHLRQRKRPSVASNLL